MLTAGTEMVMDPLAVNVVPSIVAEAVMVSVPAQLPATYEALAMPPLVPVGFGLIVEVAQEVEKLIVVDVV
jgi:hypothetical protein